MANNNIDLNSIIPGGIQAGTGLINAGAQYAQNLANQKFEAEQAAIQRDWNEEMFNKSNAWNYEMWMNTNEYNTPTAQVQRLQDAGLNPLYYNLDGSSASGVQSAQPLGYDRASLGQQMNPVSAGLDAAMKLAQVQNVQAGTNKIKSETKAINAKLPFEVDNLKAQIRKSNLDADAQETINKYIDRQQEAELRVKNTSADVNEKTIEKIGAEIEKMDYEKTTMMIGWMETQEKILNLQKQRELTDVQMRELESLIRKNNAEADKLRLDIANYDDITVIGTASTTIKAGPFTIQQGEPVTLGVLKALRAHKAQLEDQEKNKNKNKRSPDGQVSAMDGSPYKGPVYD